MSRMFTKHRRAASGIFVMVAAASLTARQMKPGPPAKTQNELGRETRQKARDAVTKQVSP
jgi:hypothetical protein